MKNCMVKKYKRPKKKRHKIPFLGKITVKWCANCHVPLIRGNECPICKSKTFPLPIAPPGDVRLAFSHDIKLLRRTCDEVFIPGIGKFLFPDNTVILLNKIGALDVDYQVFAHGKMLGNLRYDIFKNKFNFIPAKDGALYIFKFHVNAGLIKLDRNKDAYDRDRSRLPPSPPPKFIKYHEEDEIYVASGKSILVPGIECMDTDVKPGDPCIVYSNNGFLATGYYIVDASQAKQMISAGKGRIAKTKFHGEPIPPDQINSPPKYSKQQMDMILKANEPLLLENEKKAINFINRTIKNYPYPVAVAYSGGKDSLTTLLLVMKALKLKGKINELYIFFANTGLEFPEVLENVQSVIKWANLENSFFMKSAGETFWSLVEKFGPPARDFRFCCHSLKASQINDIIEDIIKDSGPAANQKVLVFIGQRRYESFNRAQERKVYVNSYIPKQIAATPIKDWNALEEWLYLLHEKKIDPSIPINPLYFQGHDRLGCYLCPAQSMYNLKLLKTSHPSLYKRWINFLENYRLKNGYPELWLQGGFWRFKKPDGQWKKLAEISGLDFLFTDEVKKLYKNVDFDSGKLKLHVTKGVSPCTAGGFSVKARFSIPLILPTILPWIQILDKRIDLDESSGLLFIDAKDIHMILYADGSIFLQSTRDDFNFNRYLKYMMAAVARAMSCQLCGVCEKVCPQNAIKIDKNSKNVIIDVNKCIGYECQKCSAHCPAFHLVKDNIIHHE
ncbi:MAG: phosphoadenosine phosphosulfate reductase domain-containing protein [Promethearchaeota archaeon]